MSLGKAAANADLVKPQFASVFTDAVDFTWKAAIRTRVGATAVQIQRRVQRSKALSGAASVGKTWGKFIGGKVLLPLGVVLDVGTTGFCVYEGVQLCRAASDAGWSVSKTMGEVGEEVDLWPFW